MIPDGGPAFPMYSPEAGTCWGMSVRDYFAAQAMAELISDASRSRLADVSRGVRESAAREQAERMIGTLPVAAYRIADAMLAERAKAVQ